MLDMARRRGTAFVMVTHDETLAAQCQRVLRLDGGRLVDVSGAVQRPAVVGPDA
jgi:lipoprotein-releasing system ATP-binding protein